MIKFAALSNLFKKVISNGIETVFISGISGEILCVVKNANKHWGILFYLCG